MAKLLRHRGAFATPTLSIVLVVCLDCLGFSIPMRHDIGVTTWLRLLY
jgi:hypothetical protein